MSTLDNLLEDNNIIDADGKTVTDDFDDSCNLVTEAESTSDIVKEEMSNYIFINNVKFCAKCGEKLYDGQFFCPKCGQKVEDVEDKENLTTNSKTNKLKKIVTIIFAVISILFVVLKFVLGPAVDNIELNHTSLEIKPGENIVIKYTITPVEASDKKVVWVSSNESIALVNEEGKVSALEEGRCTITAEVGGKTAQLQLTVVKGPDFKQIFDDFCDSAWASVASDGSYLQIDTNPLNKDRYIDYAAYLAIYTINEALELPESLAEKMGRTRALDGTQNASYDEVNVSWTYHPDNGLEVIYEMN